MFKEFVMRIARYLIEQGAIRIFLGELRGIRLSWGL